MDRQRTQIPNTSEALTAVLKDAFQNVDQLVVRVGTLVTSERTTHAITGIKRDIAALRLSLARSGEASLRDLRTILDALNGLFSTNDLDDADIIYLQNHETDHELVDALRDLQTRIDERQVVSKRARLQMLDKLDNLATRATSISLASIDSSPVTRYAEITWPGEMSRDQFRCFLAALRTSPHLRILHLKHTGLRDWEAITLAATLQDLRLDTLNVINNRISSTGLFNLTSVLRDTGISTFLFAGNPYGGVDDPMWERIVENLRDTDVVRITPRADAGAFRAIEWSYWSGHEGSVWTERLRKVLRANQQKDFRTFVLQVQMSETSSTEIMLTFRTMGGNIVAELRWSKAAPAADLPAALFSAMRASGFQFPSNWIRARNLRLVGPDQRVLDTGLDAASLVDQFPKITGVKRRRLT